MVALESSSNCTAVVTEVADTTGSPVPAQHDFVSSDDVNVAAEQLWCAL